MIHNDLTYIEGVFSRCQCKGKISSDILLLTHEYIANKGNSHESLCMYQSRDLAYSKPIADARTNIRHERRTYFRKCLQK